MIAPSETQTVLAAHGVGRDYPGVRALEDVSLSIRRGEVIGLVGENGAGKSTLLSILSGSEQPSSGYVETAGGIRGIASYGEANRRGVFRAHQDQGLIGNLSVTENLYLGHEGHFTRAGVLQAGRMRAAAQRHLSGKDVISSGIDARSLVADLDLDQRQLVEITRAFAVAELLGQDHPVVLLDETTASLDQDEVAELFSFVRSTRGVATYVFVSHRLNEILEICDRVYVLKDGKVVAERAAADTDEEELHRLMVGRDREANHYLEDKRTGVFGPVVLKVEDLSVPGNLHGVTLEVRAGEIYGIGGLTGCGKSHLAGAIAGDISSDGLIEADGRSMPNGRAVSRLGVIGYGPLDRHAEGVSLFQSIRWNTTWSSLRRLSRGGLLSTKKEKADVAEAMSRHRIVAPGDGTLVGSLSGGNQQKVMLARLISSGARVLVLDNPTRGVDVGARQEIYSLLRESVAAGLAILMVSDDMRELIGMSDRLAVMKDGRLVHEWAATEVPELTEETVVARMV